MNKSNLKTAFALSLALLFGSVSLLAQSRLPVQHEHQHNRLLANQRSAGAEIKQSKFSDYYNEIKNREAAGAVEIDEDIFNYNFDSQAVNAYADFEIPQTCNINVSKFVCPVPGAITSPYGWRARFGRMHRGVDLRLCVGDTVVSAFDGVVRLTRFERGGYGYYVVVRHDNGLETVYGHLSRFLTKPGQRVKAGEAIALGGNTGRSTGPHLHFETRFLGLAINPEAIIDFNNKVTHKDVFAFDKSTYERSQTYGPRKSLKGKSSARKHSASSKSKSKSRKSKSRRR